MIQELEGILKTLENFDEKTQKNIFKAGEIQKEREDMSDFPDLLDNIHGETTSLQRSNINNVGEILSPLIELNASLGDCTSNIEYARDVIKN